MVYLTYNISDTTNHLRVRQLVTVTAIHSNLVWQAKVAPSRNPHLHHITPLLEDIQRGAQQELTWR